ncbi:hypothetical protein ONZ43_g1370 [Nemania bipapillata]|uniref:Uncharacterized protein n=1 Tax=Nemania bipapillata TaxID=110536 RepID=A0ACC2J4M1_9PEZI|nr:hypothetical protein ONZ43_g1370 [Nemania bipapillata]
MSMNQSYLSNLKYGYDFVVTTTQASINSGLVGFMAEGKQPVKCMCFLANESGNLAEQVTLEELLEKTKNINPFDIPTDTPIDDDRIKSLNEARFCVGIKIQIGIPPGVLPKDLPPIVELGNSPSNVRFNMFCSEFTVIQYQPAGGYRKEGSWKVWSQPPSKPWHIQTEVNLVVADLNKELDTPYFRDHPDEMKALQRQLDNISAEAFSLQQLYFDLDNAALQAVPVLEGIPPGSDAATALEKSFIGLYSKTSKERGWPLVSVAAVMESIDTSQLQLTAFERQISQLRDDRGVVVQNTTPLQRSVTMLDHLCAVNNKPLPAASSFSWNWMLPTEVDQQSGVISVNRNSVAALFLPYVVKTAKANCPLCKVAAEAHWWAPAGDVNIMEITTGQRLTTISINESGEKVITIEYSDKQKKEAREVFYCAIEVAPTYVCDVYFKDTTIVTVQRLRVHLWLCIDGDQAALYPYDKTRTDTYSISVGQAGNLRISTQGPPKVEDRSSSPTPPANWAESIINWVTQLNNTISRLKEKLGDLEKISSHSISLNKLHNFIFPGAKTFVYKSVNFSDHQDLVCAITYVDSNQKRRLLRDARGANPSDSNEYSPGLTLTHSSEMMENYAQGQIVSPTEKFEALQTDKGLSMLFSLDTSGVLCVIQEQSGLALALEVGDTDWLFISLANSSSDTSWILDPAWTLVNFDAVGENPSKISIVGIMFAETIRDGQYLIVDINRLGYPGKNIARYHIDPSKSTGRFWVKTDVPVDIESGEYQSCIGRVKGPYIPGVNTDGIYTIGQAGGAPQLVYSPVENVFGSGPPQSRRFGLPGGILPSAIASARHTDPSSPLNSFTDLFSVGGRTLYRFAADEQQDNATAQPLVTHDTLYGTDQLYATIHNHVTTLWGVNSSKEVYYISCHTSHLDQPGSWSAVVPVLKDIERISPYTNRAEGSNTIFASGNGKLFRLIQASRTNAKMWRSQEIIIPSPSKAKPLSFNSYTTTLVAKGDNGLPAGDLELNISTDSSTPFYINGIYHIIGPTPVTILTDRTGTVTIVEASNDLSAAILTVAIPNDTISYIIDPTRDVFSKIASLKSEDALRNASYPTLITAGGILGNPRTAPLIKPSTSGKDLEVIATRMGILKDIWDNMKPPSTTSRLRLKPTHPGVVPTTLYYACPRDGSILDHVAMAAGDLFRWLRSGVQAVINIIKDAATNAWHFVATIAGKVYRAVLNSVEAIVGAVEWVFHAIETKIEQLVAFVKFVFEWDDIKRTYDTIHSFATMAIKYHIVTLSEIKRLFDRDIRKYERELADWAGLGDLLPLPSPPYYTGAVSPMKYQTASSMLFATHFKNNVAQLAVIESKATTDVAQKTIDNLLQVVSNEGQILSPVYVKLQELTKPIESMNVLDCFKAIIGILGEKVLSSARAVGDELLDALIPMEPAIYDFLETTIHIPVISDILEKIGVPRMTVLDLFLWIGAVSFTVVYKLSKKVAPFPDPRHVDAIKSASSWNELAELFGQTADPKTQTKMNAAALPQEVKKVVHNAGHASAGFLIFIGNFLDELEANSPSGENPFSLPTAIIGVAGAVLGGATDILVPDEPIEDETVSALARATTAMRLLSKILFCGPVQKRLAVSTSEFSALAVGDGRATSAIIDSILVMPQLLVASWHLYELSKKPDSDKRKAGILGEVATLTSCASRISYAVAANDNDCSNKQAAIVNVLDCNVATGGLQTAIAFLVE